MMFAVTPRAHCEHSDNGLKLVPEVGLDAKKPCQECGHVGENWVCLSCYEVCVQYMSGARGWVVKTHATKCTCVLILVYCIVYTVHSVCNDVQCVCVFVIISDQCKVQTVWSGVNASWSMDSATCYMCRYMKR